MLYKGETITVDIDNHNIARMVFNSPDSVNKFDTKTNEELRESVNLLSQQSNIRGLTITSAKDSFIVGADITEFSELFNESQELIEQAVVDYNSIFTGLQNLPFPTVTVLDGVALGGGFELALSTDYRIASPKAKVGLPEVKLGINPGFGGTIRLPRLIGIDNAVEWIATGKEYKADQALKVGAIDSVVSEQMLLSSADKLIADAQAGDLDFNGRKVEKSSPSKAF